MLTNGWWAWASSSRPAAANPDITIMKECLESFKRTFSRRDLVIADKAFPSLRNHGINIITGHRKPINRSLSKSQKRENKEIEIERGILSYQFNE